MASEPCDYFQKLGKVLVPIVFASSKKKEFRDRNEVIGFGRKKAIDHVFSDCGNFTSNSGVLESDHPYKPLTACRWHIQADAGVKKGLAISYDWE